MARKGKRRSQRPAPPKGFYATTELPCSKAKRQKTTNEDHFDESNKEFIANQHDWESEDESFSDVEPASVPDLGFDFTKAADTLTGDGRQKTGLNIKHPLIMGAHTPLDFVNIFLMNNIEPLCAAGNIYMDKHHEDFPNVKRPEDWQWNRERMNAFIGSKIFLGTKKTTNVRCSMCERKTNCGLCSGMFVCSVCCACEVP
jgi:hypothetical protein